MLRRAGRNALWVEDRPGRRPGWAALIKGRVQVGQPDTGLPEFVRLTSYIWASSMYDHRRAPFGNRQRGPRCCRHCDDLRLVRCELFDGSHRWIWRNCCCAAWVVWCFSDNSHTTRSTSSGAIEETQVDFRDLHGGRCSTVPRLPWADREEGSPWRATAHGDSRPALWC